MSKSQEKRITTLEAALRELLEDTQHLEHECSDDDCLVTKARRALTQTEETPEGKIAIGPPFDPEIPMDPETGDTR